MMSRFNETDLEGFEPSSAYDGDNWRPSLLVNGLLGIVVTIRRGSEVLGFIGVKPRGANSLLLWGVLGKNFSKYPMVAREIKNMIAVGIENLKPDFIFIQVPEFFPPGHSFAKYLGFEKRCRVFNNSGIPHWEYRRRCS